VLDSVREAHNCSHNVQGSVLLTYKSHVALEDCFEGGD